MSRLPIGEESTMKKDYTLKCVLSEIKAGALLSTHLSFYSHPYIDKIKTDMTLALKLRGFH